MAERDLDELYHQIYDSYLRRLKTVFIRRIDAASDKAYSYYMAIDFINMGILEISDDLLGHNTGNKDLFEIFEHYIKIGLSVKLSIKNVSIVCKIYQYV